LHQNHVNQYIVGGNKMNTIIVSGYATVPKGSTMYELNKTTGVVLEIDPVSDTIVNADFPFVTDLAKNFIARIMRGYNMTQGIEPLIEEIYHHFYTPSTDAFIKSLRTAYQRYTQTAKPRYFSNQLHNEEDQSNIEISPKRLDIRTTT
jgi:hypothetical protein